MEQKISTTDELHMTRAIEKAATLADVNEELDRNRVIVDQLQKEHVDVRFAKTAATAFNKRLTVLKLQKTADEHKADSFPLCDPELVYQMMGGDPEIVKTASIEATAFCIAYEHPAMRKTASACRKPLYEDTLPEDVLQERIGCVLAKTAAAVPEMHAAAYSARSRYEGLRTAMADALAQDKTAAFTLRRHYGQEYADVMGAGEKTDKKACVLPSGGVYDKFAALLDARQEVKLAESRLQSFRTMANELCSSADPMHKNAANEIAELLQVEEDPELALARRRRNLALGGAIAGTALAVPTGIIEGTISGVSDIASTLGSGTIAAFSNAARLYRAGQPSSVGAGALMDSELLLKDRYRDRLMALSDMSADPVLSKYRFGELLAATQKAMDIDPALESPGNRENLRPLVAKILLQNGMVSDADIAAQQSTAKSREEARERNLYTDSAEKAVDKSVQADKEAPELASVFTFKMPESLGLTEQMDKFVDNRFKALSTASDAYANAKSTNAKARINSIRGIATDMLRQQFPDHTFSVTKDGIVVKPLAGGESVLLGTKEVKALVNRARTNFDTLGDIAREDVKMQIKHDKDVREADEAEARKLKAQQEADQRKLDEQWAENERKRTEAERRGLNEALAYFVTEHNATRGELASGNKALVLYDNDGNKTDIGEHDLASFIQRYVEAEGILGQSGAKKLVTDKINQLRADRAKSTEATAASERDNEKWYSLGLQELKNRGYIYYDGGFIHPKRDKDGRIIRNKDGSIPYNPATDIDTEHVTKDKVIELGKQMDPEVGLNDH